MPKTAGLSWHPMVYHSLDVAASGKAFLQGHHRLRIRLAHELGLEDDHLFLGWITFFLALHDLGKLTESFQLQRPNLFAELRGSSTNRKRSERHDSLGFMFWIDKLRAIMQEENWLGCADDRRTLQNLYHHALGPWMRAVTGHHGKPPSLKSDQPLSHFFSEADQEAAMAFCREARQLLLPDQAPVTLPPIDKDFVRRSQRVSWWLAGLAVLVDWVGSNQAFFPYTAPTISLPEYWAKAQDQAVDALRDAGVLPSPAATASKSLFDLFNHIASATPLQRKVSQLTLGNGPQLFILEDVTGAGKTEAAMMLAHRLMSAHVGHGIYVGLPTMATANAMFTRMSEVYQSLFEEGASPSIVLAHSARDLSSQFRQAILSDPHTIEADDGRDEVETAGARCRAWLADNRKKALLGEVGVGTIDQALLAILYAKHQSLRLLGLTGKILMVDEVHACDAYMHKLLQILLEAHASMGGSAILLSATLPQTMRQELAQAFCAGASMKAPALQSQAYPLLTHIGAPHDVETPLETRDSVERTVVVESLQAMDEVMRRIEQAARAGKCVCWVRNTVADARDAFAVLQARIPADKLHLFHARFAMGDRLEIEEKLLGYVNKDSTSETRQGRVVIATQVVEQSLDLDFDLMVTDLAPIDLIIQRAGRLCRHTRDGLGNRIEGADQRGTPLVLVYSPVPEVEADRDWFARMFPKAVKVYPNHGQLWLTAKLLCEQGEFRMLDDARCLIEGVYGEKADVNIPEVLQDSFYQVFADDAASRSHAQANSINLRAGYVDGGMPCWEDALTPTRLGEARSMVRLARWDGRTLVPWAEGANAWHMSQVQVRAALLSSTATTFDNAALQAQVEATLAELPDRGKWSVLLPLCQEEGGRWRGQALNPGGQMVSVYYDENLGLLMESELGGQAL
ncbi:CRISPR-associated helicase Cas3' [Candidatus Entotheonella palauensis]|uniref:CRISPR-associated helicase Cas3' n=1 Tax=Candidatus Entotheonella palauensis TaxID=93172 RepID=UPI0015C4AB3A|nr:CRISPR-associated helicase Cas3' [Candidatus Entotheonella palauensis]